MLAAVLAAATGDGIGASDCEMLRDTTLAQPVNALTSLAYSVVGVAVIVAARSMRRPITPAAIYGSCLIAIGLGSVLFHGPQPIGSRMFHDLPILLTVIFIALHDLEVVQPHAVRTGRAMAIGTGLATALTIVDADAATIAIALGVIVIVVLEVVIARRRLRPAPADGRGRAPALIFVVAAVGAATWLLGRSDSPVCDPSATLQLHGLWHLISAFLLGLWWRLASDVGQVQAVRPGSTPVS